MASSTWGKWVSPNSQWARERRRETHSRSDAAGATSIASGSNEQQDPLQPAQQSSSAAFVGRSAAFSRLHCAAGIRWQRVQSSRTRARARTHTHMRGVPPAAARTPGSARVKAHFNISIWAWQQRLARVQTAELQQTRFHHFYGLTQTCAGWQPGCHRVRETMGPSNWLMCPRGTKAYVLKTILSLLNETDDFKWSHFIYFKCFIVTQVVFLFFLN